MSPRQILQEILNDYKYQLKSGMNVAQALDILKSQVIDLIEYEKQIAYDMGLDAGYYSLDLAQSMGVGTDQQQDTHNQGKQRQQLRVNAQAKQANSSDNEKIDPE